MKYIARRIWKTLLGLRPVHNGLGKPNPIQTWTTSLQGCIYKLKGYLFHTFCAHKLSLKVFSPLSLAKPIDQTSLRILDRFYVIENPCVYVTSITFNSLIVCVYKNEVTTYFCCYQGID